MPSNIETLPPQRTVYKVAPRALWDGARDAGAFAGSNDDVRDGFIHLSTAGQLAGTLARHYANQADLLLIAFNAAALGDALRWETSRGGDLFPHLYAVLPVALALWERPLPLGADGAPVADEDWLTC